MIKSPSETIFYKIEKSIKEYRRFAYSNIHEKVANLTLDQTLLLISLNENPKLSLTQQSELLFKDRASITRMLDALSKKKYIVRSINKNDKRKFNLLVTEKGKDTIKSLTNIIQLNRKKALKGLSEDDLVHLASVLSKIINNCTMIVLLLSIFIISNNLCYSQNLNNKNEKEDFIENVNNIIVDNYVFPEVGNKIKHFLSKKQKEGAYDKIKDPILFAELLTTDIQSISNDKHLRVLYEPERIKKREKAVSVADSLKNVIERRNWLKSINYGFQEVKILEGNIGYLDLRRFSNPEDAGGTADAVFEFLRNTDAIIFDIRQNGGGTPKMVQWIVSYFIEDTPFLLNTFYKRWMSSQSNFGQYHIQRIKGFRIPSYIS